MTVHLRCQAVTSAVYPEAVHSQWQVLYTQTAVPSQCQAVTSALYPDSWTLTVPGSDKCSIPRWLYTHSCRQCPAVSTHSWVINDPPQVGRESLSSATTQGKTLGDSVPLIILPVEVPFTCLLLSFALNIGKEAVMLDFGTDDNKFSLELMLGNIALAMPQASTTEKWEVNYFNKSGEERQMVGAFVLSLCALGHE